MRILLTLCFSLLLTTAAYTQIQRGDLLTVLGRQGGVLAPYPVSLGGINVSENPFTETTNVSLSAGLTLGYAVLDRVVVGANVGGAVSYSRELGGDITLEPFARYYFVNRPGLGVFGEAGSRYYAYENQGGSLFEQLTLRAGVQLPVAPGLLFTPAVGYGIQQGSNPIFVGAGLEFLLQPRAEDAEAVGGFGKGTITVGAQSVSLARRDGVLLGGLSVGGQYFLTDRLAAGVQLGVNYLRINSGSSVFTTQETYGGFGLEVGGSARYYLTPPSRLVWFLDGGAGYAFGTRTSNVWLDRVISHDLYLSAGGGAQYFIRSNVALEATPQLRYNFTEDPFNPRTRFGVNLGFRVLL